MLTMSYPTKIQEEEVQQVQRKVVVRVKTNRGVNLVTAVRAEATISQLAKRALEVFLQLVEYTGKQLTVIAVKQGEYFLPKNQIVGEMLKDNDVVEIIIVKAKPKYPYSCEQDSQHKKNRQEIIFNAEQRQQRMNKEKNNKIQMERIQTNKYSVKESQINLLKHRIEIKKTNNQERQTKKQKKQKKKQERKRSQDKRRQELIQKQEDSQEENKKDKKKNNKEQKNIQQINIFSPKIPPSPKITFHNSKNNDTEKTNQQNYRKKSIEKLQSPVMKSPLVNHLDELGSFNLSKPQKEATKSPSVNIQSIRSAIANSKIKNKQSPIQNKQKQVNEQQKHVLTHQFVEESTVNPPIEHAKKDKRFNHIHNINDKKNNELMSTQQNKFQTNIRQGQQKQKKIFPQLARLSHPKLVIVQEQEQSDFKWQNLRPAVPKKSSKLSNLVKEYHLDSSNESQD